MYWDYGGITRNNCFPSMPGKFGTDNNWYRVIDTPRAYEEVVTRWTIVWFLNCFSFMPRPYNCGSHVVLNFAPILCFVWIHLFPF